MPGHVQKRKNGSWLLVIEKGYNEDGKRLRFTKAFKGNKRDAEKELARLVTQMETGVFIEPSEMTVGAT